MPRKNYADLFKTGTRALRESRDVMLYSGTGPPGIDTLGDVFQHVYRGIEKEEESSIKRAFADCDLSLDNPFHWADLLRVMCDLHYGPQRNEGKKTRTPAFYEQLRTDRLSLAAQGCSGQSAQARKLRNIFPTRYRQTFETLLRIIQYQDSGK